MNSISYSVLMSATIVVVGGCANFSPASKAGDIENGKSYWLSYDASRRGTLVLAEGQKIKTCAEPSPDVALSFVNTLKGSLSAPSGISVTGADAALNATAQALAGRNDVVLLAREALFRICESSINEKIKPDDVKDLIKEVFSYTADIAKEQAKIAESKSKAIQAEADLQKEKIKIESLKNSK